jgi:hypothetical protein
MTALARKCKDASLRNMVGITHKVDLKHFPQCSELSSRYSVQLSFHPNAPTAGALGTPALAESCVNLCGPPVYIVAGKAS